MLEVKHRGRGVLEQAAANLEFDSSPAADKQWEHGQCQCGRRSGRPHVPGVASLGNQATGRECERARSDCGALQRAPNEVANGLHGTHVLRTQTRMGAAGSRIPYPHRLAGEPRVGHGLAHDAATAAVQRPINADHEP